MQGAFANSELPTGEQTVMAGLPEEDEPKLMPFGFAVHDESFFRVPEWHGLQARLQTRDATAIIAPRPIQALAHSCCCDTALEGHGRGLGLLQAQDAGNILEPCKVLVPLLQSVRASCSLNMNPTPCTAGKACGCGDR